MVFDSGWEDWALAWSKVQPEVAKWTCACSYDRAGAGFSDPGPMPRTSLRIAEELRTALHHAAIRGPYILVGSAFGGDNVRTFADLYMERDDCVEYCPTCKLTTAVPASGPEPDTASLR